MFLFVLAQWIFAFNIMQLPTLAWLLLMVLYAIVLFLSVPRRFYSTQTLRAITQVPVLMISMVKALLKIKSGRKEFLHTPKTFHSDK